MRSLSDSLRGVFKMIEQLGMALHYY